MIARYYSAIIRRVSWRMEVRRKEWTVILAMDLDSPELRAQATSALGEQPTMWVTTSSHLGRSFPDTWIVHRIDPHKSSQDLESMVAKWTKGAMRVTKLVDLREQGSNIADLGGQP